MNHFIKIFSSISKIKLQSWIFILVIIGAAFLISLTLKKDKQKQNTTKKLTYGSICIALSFVLSYIRFFKMPQGGSITAGSMLPVMLFAYWFGPADGVIAGMVYGLLQFIQDPFIVHPLQVVLDYPLAFGALGLAGLSKKNFSLSLAIGTIFRFLFSFLSGTLFFVEYAKQVGEAPVVYSLAYNSVILIDGLICIAISLIPQFKSAINRVKSRI
ncbi:MAG TPA: energy-coupled thiamine transporter ThiT [Clostridiaceae bacterium]|jgi:thiamine transporter|nr:energy-coupled thiamine transporter ThiT [Clostridiaceae bacterium]HCL50402.1 energy-coupled thiamine transporter ThiT [Clostridiaceae bacterium]